MATPTTVQVKMQLRLDTAATWASVNPTLLNGEMGLETDTQKIKIGDGSTAWNSLSYFPFLAGGGIVNGNLEIGSTGTLTFEGSTVDGYETQLAVTDPTADRTITLPDVSGTVVTTGDTGSVTSTMLADGTIVNADINASAAIDHSKLATMTAGYVLVGNASNVPTATQITGDVTISDSGVTAIGSGVIVDADIAAGAEIAVSKLANGTANQVLVTDGTDVSWSDDLTIAGNLTVNGTTTTVNTQTLVVEDKNIELGVVDTPTDLTADGGGITLKGTTDKTINWIDSTDSWTSSENIDLANGKSYRINDTEVLSATTLGSGVTSSSLTSVGTISAGTWQGTAIAAAYLDSTVVTTGDTGTVTSTMIADGTIVNADVSASAAIAGSKIDPDFGSQTIETTGVFSAAAGSDSAPSITFTGDLNTGIYSPGADQLALSTNGDGRLFVDASGRVHIGTTTSTHSYIQTIYGSTTGNRGAGTVYQNASTGADSSNGFLVGNSNGADAYVWNYENANTIFATSGTERLRITSAGLVGIGSSSPSSLLHLEGSSPDLTIRDSQSFTTSDGPLLQFQGRGSNAVNYNFGYIRGVSSGVNNAGILQFATNSAGTQSVAVTIDSSQRVGIGTTSPSVKLEAADTSDLEIKGRSETGNVRFGMNVVNGTYNWIQSDRTTSALQFAVGNAERARIDSSGRLLVGTSSARTNFFNTSNQQTLFQVERVGLSGTQSYQTASFITNSADGVGAYVTLGASRGTTVNSYTALQSGDIIGKVAFQGADGAELVSAAEITALVDGTPGANDMPGRLVFSSTPSGSASPVERMRITSGGQVLINKTSSTGQMLQVTHSADVLSPVARFDNNAATATNQYGLFVNLNGDPNDSTRYFLQCNGAASTQRATIRSNGGLANYQANDVNLSDRNAKKDISPAAGTWDCIKEWEIVNYRYKDQPDDADLNLGVIAQQVAESCPEVITVFEEAKDDQPEKLGIKEQQMYWMAIKALQEAQVRIEQLEQRLADAGIA